MKTAGVAESDTHKVSGLTYDPAPHYSALEQTKMGVTLGAWFSKHVTGQTAAGVENVFLGIWILKKLEKIIYFHIKLPDICCLFFVEISHNWWCSG